MTADTSSISAVTAMRDRLQQGVNASPLCIAVMGWLCDTPTSPSVAATSLYDGDVWLRLSDENILEPFCPFLDFLAQVHVICVSLHMSEEQTQHIIALARRRLG